MSNKNAWAAAWALLLAGCATSPPVIPNLWAPLELVPNPPPGSYKSAPAVVLYRKLGVRIALEPDGEETRYEQHSVVHLRAESELDRAEVKIRHPRKGRVEFARAKVTHEDGRSQEYDIAKVAQTLASEGPEESGWTDRVYRIPDVRVGDRLEIHYAVIRPWTSWWTDDVAEAVPVRRYELELLIDKRLEYEFKGVHTRSKFQESREEGMQRLSWAEDEIPAREAEGWAPHFNRRLPWWVMRITEGRRGSHRFRIENSWGESASGWSRSLILDAKQTDGVAAMERVERCADAPCRISAAWERVRAETELDAWRKQEVWEARPLKVVLQKREATPAEKATLLRKRLLDLGIDAKLAAISTEAARIPADFPMMRWFDGLLVYVPKTEGLSEPLWLDPACEVCGPGELPARLTGITALVFDAKERLNLDPVWYGELLQTAAKSSPRERYVGTLRAVVDEAGGAVFEEGKRSEGTRLGTWFQGARTQSAADRLTERQKALSDALPGAVVTEASSSCDKLGGFCSSRARFTAPGFATVAGARMVIPIPKKLWKDSSDDDFERPSREFDVEYPFEDDSTYTLEVEVPEGWVYDGGPAEFSFEHRAAKASGRVEKTANGVRLIRKIHLRQGSYPKEDYPHVRKVVRAFSGFKDTALVFKRK